MLDKINELINKVNMLSCGMNNVQKYVGTSQETDYSTITGRITELERRINLGEWVDTDEWTSIDEWGDTPVNQTIEDW